jgi:hypothetical protein
MGVVDQDMANIIVGIPGESTNRQQGGDQKAREESPTDSTF